MSETRWDEWRDAANRTITFRLTISEQDAIAMPSEQFRQMMAGVQSIKDAFREAAGDDMTGATDKIPLLMTDYHRTDPKDWPKPKPRAKEVMGDMNDDMQRFLRAAMVAGVDPADIGEDQAFHPNTLRALLKHELVHLVATKKKRELWRPTDTGRGVSMRHEPRFLRAKPGSVRYKTLPPAAGRTHGRHVVDDGATGEGDYTGEHRLAMRNEPESLGRAA